MIIRLTRERIGSGDRRRRRSIHRRPAYRLRNARVEGGRRRIGVDLRGGCHHPVQRPGIIATTTGRLCSGGLPSFPILLLHISLSSSSSSSSSSSLKFLQIFFFGRTLLKPCQICTPRPASFSSSFNPRTPRLLQILAASIPVTTSSCSCRCTGVSSSPPLLPTQAGYHKADTKWSVRVSLLG
jgi:hypothetical protein